MNVISGFCRVISHDYKQFQLGFINHPVVQKTASVCYKIQCKIESGINNICTPLRKRATVFSEACNNKVSVIKNKGCQILKTGFDNTSKIVKPINDECVSSLSKIVIGNGPYNRSFGSNFKRMLIQHVTDVALFGIKVPVFFYQTAKACVK